MAKTTQTQTTKPATKAANKPATRKASPKAAGNTPVVAKATSKPQTTKASIFALVAGTVVKVESKLLKKAITYHVKQGNLKSTAAGIELTAQGAKKYHADRIVGNEAEFQKIAAFTHGGATLPEFGGDKKTAHKVANGLQLPSLEFWGSFSTMRMRLAFASLWASK